MPFKSKAQARACFAKKSRGQAKGWDCEEWAEDTNYKKLPRKVKQGSAGPSLIEVLAAEAARITLTGRQR